MHRLEYVENGSSKFWMAEVNQTTLVVQFGRIGSQGQVQVKTFSTSQAACAERDRKLAEKRRKGYREVAASEADRAKLVATPSVGPLATATSTPQPGFWARLFGAKPVPVVAARPTEICCEYCDWRLAPSALRCENCGARAPSSVNQAA